MHKSTSIILAMATMKSWAMQAGTGLGRSRAARRADAGARTRAGAHEDARGELEPRRIHPRPRLQKPGTWKALGIEGAGELVKVAPGVGGFSAGQRVMARCPGAFSEYALVDAREMMAIPETLSWERPRPSPHLPRRARHAVAQGRLRAGEWLLVTGASSGIGCRLAAGGEGARRARDRHVRLAGEARPPAGARPRCRAETRGADFHDAVMQATGGKGV
jgi:hypothetical protein